MTKIDVLGVKFNKQNKEEILEEIARLVGRGERHYVVTPNPEFVVLARKDKQFLKILNNASFSIPDGIGIVLASKILYGPRGLRGRITGVDLMVDICRLAAKKNWSIFLLGAGDGVAEKCALKLKEKYGVNILGTYSGWADSAGDIKTRRTIKNKVGQKKCQFIFVAYGAGKQEKWIKRNLEKIPVEIAMGVGGSFDFLSGKIKRAPGVVRKIGLEWLWRLMKEPWRWRRQLTLPEFTFLVLKKKLKKRNC